MLISLDPYLHPKNLIYPLITSTDIDDQRILQSHWTQLVTPNQKWQSPMLPSRSDYLHTKNLRYLLIPSRDIDDQIILKSD